LRVEAYLTAVLPPVAPVPLWPVLAPVAAAGLVVSVAGFAVVLPLDPGLTCVLVLAAVPADGFIDWSALAAPPTF
jgi:hypothetical protein